MFRLLGPPERAGLAVGFRKMRVHPRTRRTRIDLHEKLPYHLALQAFTDSREVTRGFARAGFARETHFDAHCGVIIFGGGFHVRKIMQCNWLKDQGV